MEKILDRFLRYVAVDTQSCEESESQPSSAAQSASGAALPEPAGKGLCWRKGNLAWHLAVTSSTRKA